jgi:hypothetical protein
MGIDELRKIARESDCVFTLKGAIWAAAQMLESRPTAVVVSEDRESPLWGRHDELSMKPRTVGIALEYDGGRVEFKSVASDVILSQVRL